MKTAPNITVVFAEAKRAIIAKSTITMLYRAHQNTMVTHLAHTNRNHYGTFSHNRKFRLNENHPQHNSGLR